MGKKNRLFMKVARGLLLLALAALLPSLSGAETIPTDLDLDRGPAMKILNEPGPNPHETFPCQRCHEKTDHNYETAVKYGLEIPLITEGDTSLLLCEECHGESSHSFHPINFPVRRLAGQVEALGIFPLETIVEGYDKLTCISCHDIHFPSTGNRLLRGFPLVPGEREGGFASRIDFCSSCHGEEIRAFSSHWDKEAGEKCNACHLGYREPGIPGTLKRRLNESCVVCHPLPSGRDPHFYSYNPFPDFDRQELASYGLTLEKGQFTCNTCHTHHRPEESSNFLRPSFVTIVSKSLRVNPHRTTKFCQNCHPFEPEPVGTPGAVAPLWEEDVTRLCRGCHSKEGALKMYHPLTIPAKEGMIPEGWSVRKDGSLGCQTCHLDGHGPPDPANPKMLRGGDYVERSDVCFHCHDRGAYRGRNIHADVAGADSCDFCHVVKNRTALSPEGTVGDLVAEPSLLCLLCHSPPPHPASSDHTGRPHKHSFVTLDEEITPLTMGKVTCHTCHDSHSPSLEENYLRKTGAATLVCDNCHPF